METINCPQCETELMLMADDGAWPIAHRLWSCPQCEQVANEAYDTDTLESHGLDDDLAGWGYTDDDISLV